MSAAPAIRLEEVSKWYGQVLGLSGVNMTIERGVIGLLGPNGAGKSTMMRLLCGLARPSRGRVLVYGEDVVASSEVRRRLGYCPEHEGLYDELTASEFVAYMAELSGMGKREARHRSREILVSLGLENALDRRLAGFSKGMRQRAKLAQAMVHDPDMLVLDEPLTGCDPVARNSILSRLRALAAAGKVILVSSHVLHEIEAITQEIVLLYRGQVLAEGNVYRIRELIDKHPHRVRVECDRPRELARHLITAPHVVRAELAGSAVELETRAPDELYDAIPKAVLELGIRIESLSSPDNNMQSVFEYLTAAGGKA
ncbi:MAG: ABC transporter ATP-binding protein [Deltaproteobacteria bacterium]|nr:ABC transporter ATP-binding protein [Deltaproteobacteria bacterium]